MTSNRSEMVERVLPEAPHWNGVGKYEPALCMENCTLHIMSRGFGANDGDGYLTFDPDEFDWERDEDGNHCVVVPANNSDLLFLRDHLNALFPNTRAAAQPLSDSVVERVAAILELPENEFTTDEPLSLQRAYRIAAAIPSAGGVEPQDTGVPASPSGQSAKPEPSCTVSARGATVPNAAWLSMSCVPTHGRRIYALQRDGKAQVAFANPELQRSLFLAWWPLPEDRLTAPPESAGQ